MSCIGKSWQLFLDQSREETCSNRQCSVVEIVMRVVHGAAAHGAGITNVDKGAGAGFEYICKILCTNSRDLEPDVNVAGRTRKCDFRIQRQEEPWLYVEV